MKVSELTGAELDYWVAQAEGKQARYSVDRSYVIVDKFPYSPSDSWTIGGPIIERERIDVLWWTSHEHWRAQLASSNEGFRYQGKTLLIAAMRAYVANKFGETVGVESEGKE